MRQDKKYRWLNFSLSRSKIFICVLFSLKNLTKVLNLIIRRINFNFSFQILFTKKCFTRLLDKRDRQLDKICKIFWKATVTTKNEIKQYVRSTGNLLKQGCMPMLETLKYIKKSAPNCQNTFVSWKTITLIKKFYLEILHRIGKVRNPQKICMSCTYEKMKTGELY